MEDENKKIDDIIKKVLQFFPEVVGIYLFGTLLTIYETEESDVDLALLFPVISKLSTHSPEFWDLHFELTKTLDRDVDLILLRKVDTVFQHEIIQSGRLLYIKDKYQVEEFEMLTMSSYQKLNEERAEILQEILESGMVLSK